MFHLISLSPHFIDHVSFLFPSVHSPSHSFHLPQSISFMFTLFGCIHITWSFNLIVSFTFQPIPSLEINNLRVSLDKFLILDIHYLKLTFSVFTTPCLFILSKKYNTLHHQSAECSHAEIGIAQNGLVEMFWLTIPYLWVCIMNKLSKLYSNTCIGLGFGMTLIQHFDNISLPSLLNIFCDKLIIILEKISSMPPNSQ